MAAQTKKTTIHGVEVTQVNYQGKWYTPVAARVQIAEQADPDAIRTDGRGYHVVSVQIIQMGEQWAYHCMVEYPIGSGVIRPGTDFIDMSDKKSGIAKAETSAIGRALGLHGIAIEEGIASAEEVRRSGGASMSEMDEGERAVESPVTYRQPAQSTSTKTDAPDVMDKTEASPEDQKILAEKIRNAGYDTLTTAGRFLREATGRANLGAADLREGTSNLTLREMAKVQLKLAQGAPV